MESEAVNLFVKSELLKHINGEMAFLPLPKFVREVPFHLIGKRVHGLPYSFYEQFYHVWFAQRDILNFMLNETYRTPQWPTEYWSATPAPESPQAWENKIAQYEKDCNALEHALSGEANLPLLQPVKHATSDAQTLLRELLLIIAHTAYHTGQLQVIKRLLVVN